MGRFLFPVNYALDLIGCNTLEKGSCVLQFSLRLIIALVSGILM